MTVLIDKLVKLGYVKKVKDTHDAGVYRLSVTEKGENLRAIFEEISEKLISKIYQDFTLDEKFKIIELLLKIQL